MLPNDKNELIPTRTNKGCKVCIDYQRLNKWIEKDHFPMPFMDQMLDRLSRWSYLFFLDGFSGYNQITIALKD